MCRNWCFNARTELRYAESERRKCSQAIRGDRTVTGPRQFGGKCFRLPVTSVRELIWMATSRNTVSSASGGARCGHGSAVTCSWNCRIAKKASCQACDMPNCGRVKTSRYSNSIRSSNASRNRRAKSASTSRPGGPKGERSPETRTLVSSTQTGTSATPRSLLTGSPCGSDLSLYVCGRDNLRTTLVGLCPHRAYRPTGTGKYDLADILKKCSVTGGNHDAAGNPVLGDHQRSLPFKFRPHLAWRRS